jgi:hypothetical protein
VGFGQKPNPANCPTRDTSGAAIIGAVKKLSPLKGTQMFNRESLKLGLTGAILVIIMGSFTACSDEGPTGPTAQYDTTHCWLEDGKLVCAE